MAIFTTTSIMSDGSGSRKKATTNPAQPKTQTTAVSTAQKSANYRQQSNVQTQDLVYAKSQPGWQNNLERVQQKAAVRKDAYSLAEKKQTQNPWNDPQIYIPNLSTNERPFVKPVSYVQEETALRAKAAAAGMNYDSVMRDAYRAVNKANTEQRNKSMAEVAEYSPMLGSALSVLMMPADLIGAAQVGAGALLGRPTDPNDPVFQSTNARQAMQNAVAEQIAAEQGEKRAEQYRTAMGIAEAAYGSVLAAGGLSGVVDIGSSAATQYINLINSGVSPEAAGKMVGARAVLDAVGETGVFDDAVGAAVKKSGLMDTMVEWGRKIPGAKKVIDAVEERLDTQMFKAGMELNDLNLTRKKENDLIKLKEKLYGYTDEEAGKIVQRVASELTHTDTNATIESNNAVFLKSRNMKLEGERHPETNVLFERTSLELGGIKCEIVEPRFDHAGQIELDRSAYKASRRKQRKISNTTLASDPLQQEQLKSVFTDSQITAMKNGVTPSGYVWHHAATPGVMQLVRSDIHAKTGHTGGYSIWGSGADTGGL